MFILRILPVFFLFSFVINSFAQTNKSFHQHEKWDQLTQKYVTDNGFVNYKGFIKDSTKLNVYLKELKFIHLGEETYDLNNIEHNILRKEWDDARVHAVVNCASVSCPALRKGAFTGDKVEEQMDEQMKSFINDKTKNTISENKADVSSLFKWFSGDFKNNAPSVIAYINKYSKVKIKPGAEITYKDYDWSLNEAKKISTQ